MCSKSWRSLAVRPPTRLWTFPERVVPSRESAGRSISSTTLSVSVAGRHGSSSCCRRIAVASRANTASRAARSSASAPPSNRTSWQPPLSHSSAAGGWKASSSPQALFRTPTRRWKRCWRPSSGCGSRRATPATSISSSYRAHHSSILSVLSSLRIAFRSTLKRQIRHAFPSWHPRRSLPAVCGDGWCGQLS